MKRYYKLIIALILIFTILYFSVADINFGEGATGHIFMA
jgi:hypothetical protein